MRLTILHSSALSRPNIPLVERLETRTLLSAAPTARAPQPAKTTFPVSDIFGASAGVPIWQNGQPVVPGGSTGGTSNAAMSSALSSASAISAVSGSSNSVLLTSATVPGASAIFSLLPVLPPDGLAAAIVGLIDTSYGPGSGTFRGG